MRARILCTSGVSAALAYLLWKRHEEPAPRSWVYIQTGNGLIIDE